ncbi:MAG: DUF429 domain-containing protein [Chloroflexi bacterium]|nr:DUF429 domain-containing protein [Chloroflexota bacterium]
MTAILGIDAAWTVKEPSGVAVVVKRNSQRWQCCAIAPSYTSFLSLNQGIAIDWSARLFPGVRPPPVSILSAAEDLAGESIDVVTVDMPVSTVQITQRREADNAVSRAFGEYGCGTHTPNPQRPGRIGEELSGTFADLGYSISATGSNGGTINRLIEVYPHPALLRLLNEKYRLPYKQGKSTKYWPGLDIRTRIGNLLIVYRRILNALSGRIDNIALVLPAQSDVPTLAFLKRYEDSIDALVCAWVGIEYIEGRCAAYGDASAAIWIPA